MAKKKAAPFSPIPASQLSYDDASGSLEDNATTDAPIASKVRRVKKKKSVKEAKDSGDPESRKAVADDAYERNHPTSRPGNPELLRYQVTWGEKSHVTMAPNPRDAWAHACDHWKRWPSPKQPGISIERA